MPDPVKRLLEVYEVVEQITLVLYVLLYDDMTIKDLFYCAPTWSKTSLLLCQQFFCLDFESVEDNSEHDLTWMADQAYVTIVLTLLEVAFLW